MLKNASLAESVFNETGISKRWIYVCGAVLGYVSGLIGIGGGIFLAPVLHRLNWGSSKEIAMVCSVFIGINSCVGLVGHLYRLSWVSVDASLLILPLMVIVGAFIGARWGASVASEMMIKRLTGFLILMVAVRVILKSFSL